MRMNAVSDSKMFGISNQCMLIPDSSRAVSDSKMFGISNSTIPPTVTDELSVIVKCLVYPTYHPFLLAKKSDL